MLVIPWLVFLFHGTYATSDSSDHEDHLSAADEDTVERQLIDENKLGRGGFGTVYRVRLNGILYAAKETPKSKPSQTAEERKSQDRAVRTAYYEINLLNDLKGLEYIVQCHGFFENSERVVFLLDFAQHGDLHSMGKLARKTYYNDKYTTAQSLRYIEELAKFTFAEVTMALRNFHSLKMIHRDIKSENVLVYADGHIKLADFGVSERLVDVTKSKRDSGAGTLITMPRETLARTSIRTGRNRSVKKTIYVRRSDFFSMGIMLHEFLVGYNPYIGANKKFESVQDKVNCYVKNVTDPNYVLNLDESLEGFSHELIDFLKGLLGPLEERLGSRGAAELLSVPWLKGFDPKKVKSPWLAILPKKPVPEPVLGPSRQKKDDGRHHVPKSPTIRKNSLDKKREQRQREAAVLGERDGNARGVSKRRRSESSSKGSPGRGSSQRRSPPNGKEYVAPSQTKVHHHVSKRRKSVRGH